MKRCAPIVSVLLSIFFVACGNPNATHEVYITHAVISSVTAKRLFFDTAEVKMQSSVLALYNQYIQNGNTTELPEAVLASDELLILSEAKVNSKDKVYLYLYQTIGGQRGQLMNELSSQNLDLTIIDTTKDSTSFGYIYQVWVPIADIRKVATANSLRHIGFVTDPLRSSNTSDFIRKPEADVIAQMPTSAAAVVGVISDDCGSDEDILDDCFDGGTLDESLTSFINDASIFRTHEGLAMMEVVHQMASFATIKFSTGTLGMASFMNSIHDLSEADCNIIVDDLLYLEEPAFSDGPIVDIIDHYTAEKNIIYVASAGNFAKNVFSFTFNPKPGTFYGRAATEQVGTVHYDLAGSLKQTFFLSEGQAVELMLQWDDPFGASKNNFDLYLVDIASGEIVNSSITPQHSSLLSDPYEHLLYKQNPCWGSQGYRIEIVREEGVGRLGASAVDNQTPRMKLMIIGLDDTDDLPQPNSIFGHACGKNVIACAAMPTSGLINTVQAWSSRGAAQIVDVAAPTVLGSRIPDYRRKPDIAGLDGIETSVDNYTVFCGTSAAAPVVAGILAMLKGSESTATRLQLINALLRGSIDYETDGIDMSVGYGRADAFRSVAYLKQSMDTGNCIAHFTADAIYRTNTGTPPPLDKFDIRAAFTIKHACVSLTLDGCTSSAPLTANAKQVSSSGLSITIAKVLNEVTQTWIHSAFMPGDAAPVNNFRGISSDGTWSAAYTTTATNPIAIRDFGIFIRK